ncbi:MAG: ATP-binding cassette domain-containing protein [Chitinivibrionales bacterium]|nr:ATP-binding cassette domain-containing protein [Chitinivibrionales bacterium]
MNALEINDLSKNYSGERALDGISFTVDEGALFGIIGPDGAGKTTLMRILATLINPDSGTAHVLSHTTTGEHRPIREKIGYMPQRFSLYEDLSVRENMLFFADIFGVTGKERDASIDRLLEFSRLGPFQDRRAGALSGGMKQKLALSCALIHTPSLLILDEPTTGVDPVSRKQFWSILRKLQRDGISILISTPYMDEAEYCSHLILMHRGKILRQGAPERLKEEYPLQLFRITAQGENLHFPQSEKPPAGLQLLYPSRGALHAATEQEGMESEQVLESVKSFIPQAQVCRPVEPRIEDIFFYTLASGDTQ